MTGTKLAVAVLSFVAFLGSNQVQKSLDCYVSNSPRVLYLMAQYKMTVGDTAAGVRLLKQATVSSEPQQAPRSEGRVDTASKPCPDSSRS